MHLQLKLNPWKVCCFEFVTRQLLETEALTDFDAEACYVDMRMAHSYGLLEGGGEREAGLPDFFDPAVAERLSAWRLAQQTLAGLERIRSPTQLALALVLVYKYTEQAVGKLLLNAQYRKFARRHRGAPGEPLRPAVLPRPEPAPSHVQDLGMDFEARALGDEPAPEEAPESEPEPSCPPAPAAADFDERPYTPEPGLPPFEPAPVVFGMDEVMPAVVYLVLRVRPPPARTALRPRRNLLPSPGLRSRNRRLLSSDRDERCAVRRLLVRSRQRSQARPCAAAF